MLATMLHISKSSPDIIDLAKEKAETIGKIQPVPTTGVLFTPNNVPFNVAVSWSDLVDGWMGIFNE